MKHFRSGLPHGSQIRPVPANWKAPTSQRDQLTSTDLKEEENCRCYYYRCGNRRERSAPHQTRILACLFNAVSHFTRGVEQTERCLMYAESVKQRLEREWKKNQNIRHDTSHYTNPSSKAPPCYLARELLDCCQRQVTRSVKLGLPAQRCISRRRLTPGLQGSTPSKVKSIMSLDPRCLAGLMVRWKEKR